MNTFGNFNNMNLRGMNNNRLGYYSPIPQMPPQIPPQNQYYSNQGGVSTNIEMIQGGEASVNALQLPNNTINCYFDDNFDVVYIKEVDGNGRATVQAYDLVPKGHNQEPPALAIDTSIFVTKEQLEELSGQFTEQIASLGKRINDVKSRLGNINKKEGNK